MSTAANVDLSMDQGADFACQLYWTSGENQPYNVMGPMRMEIRNSVGNVVATLQTNETSEDEENQPDNQSIGYNSDSGLIQLYIDAATSDLIPAGVHDYDLFVSYLDSNITQRIRKQRLLYGKVMVNGRITHHV